MTTRQLLTPRSARTAMRLAMLSLLLSVTVLQRFGVGADEFSVRPALVAVYLVLLVAVVAGVLSVSRTRVLLYLAAVGLALTSSIVNEHRSSLSSLLLLTVIYLPFVFVLEPNSLAESDGDWLMRQFLGLSLVCAVVGIAQFFAQFVIHGEWLFDFTQALPAALHGGGVFNTVISVGDLNKSNGFFFREPSSFSFVMALALVAESVSHRRAWRTACYALALLLTYSGTGVLALLIGASYPLGRKTLLRLGVVACVGSLVFLLLEDVLHLSFTLGRVSEFGSDSSSGYIRYVAPGRLLGELFSSEPWSAWIGHGPGTIFRTTREYAFHDPTWAKLLFEYGALGFTVVVGLFALTLRGSFVPVQVRAVLFWGWLVMGGNLLSPEQNYLTLLLVGLLPLGAGLDSWADRALASEGASATPRAIFPGATPALPASLHFERG